MKGYIYKYTGPTGLIYIGQTINIKDRQYQHKVSKENNKFHKAIRELGFDNFNFEIISTITIEDESSLYSILDSLEIYYISYYDSYNSGYNSTPGGSEVSRSSGKLNIRKTDTKPVKEKVERKSYKKIICLETGEIKTFKEWTEILDIGNSVLYQTVKGKGRYSYKNRHYKYLGSKEDYDTKIIEHYQKSLLPKKKRGNHKRYTLKSDNSIVFTDIKSCFDYMQDNGDYTKSFDSFRKRDYKKYFIKHREED